MKNRDLCHVNKKDLHREASNVPQLHPNVLGLRQYRGGSQSQVKPGEVCSMVDSSGLEGTQRGQQGEEGMVSRELGRRQTGDLARVLPWKAGHAWKRFQHTLTQTYSHTHTYSQALSQTRTHPLTQHSLTHTDIHTYVHTQTVTHRHTLTQTCTHVHTQTHTHKHRHTPHIHSLTRTHTHTDTQRRTPTLTDTHVPVHAHSDAHTHRHTHTARLSFLSKRLCVFTVRF
jgi:hypothetical protein